ncbi:MAG: hypothetical protein K9G62_09035 [Alphaproteobacteria bacterium]|nr:hypothetical protein [Alphaproteobacteria bacterium]
MGLSLKWLFTPDSHYAPQEDGNLSRYEKEVALEEIIGTKKEIEDLDQGIRKGYELEPALSIRPKSLVEYEDSFRGIMTKLDVYFGFFAQKSPIAVSEANKILSQYVQDHSNHLTIVSGMGSTLRALRCLDDKPRHPESHLQN